jgi:hypothetical protein
MPSTLPASGCQSRVSDDRLAGDRFWSSDAELARTSSVRASWQPPTDDVLEGRRGSPLKTLRASGEPFVTAVRRNTELKVNYSYVKIRQCS